MPAQLTRSALWRKIEQTAKQFDWYKSWANGNGLPLEQFAKEQHAPGEHAQGQSAQEQPAQEQLAFEQLPLLTADVLEACYYTEPPPFADTSALYAYRTSGTSTGRRKTIYYSEEDEAQYVTIKARMLKELLHDCAGGKVLSDMGTGHAAATAVAVFEQAGMEAHAIAFDQPVQAHLDMLARLRPDVLYTMPSILERIVLAAGSQAAHYGLRKVILVGEMASLAWQQRMAAALGLPPEQLIDTVGSIEIGTIAWYHHGLGRYLLVDGLYAEGVSHAPGVVAAGELPADEQVLVLTSFVRTAFPALRYVTYDVVKDLRCVTVDGVQRQSFKALVKRLGPELKHGEKISLYDIEEVVYRYVQDAGIRVSMEANGLTVRIIAHEVTREQLHAVQAALTDRIPEIGQMIRGGLLQDIRVEAAAYTDELYLQRMKSKRIDYK